ncbi:MAG: hypothetical protein ACTSQP_22895 [Promethearchaeota archaeon]
MPAPYYEAWDLFFYQGNTFYVLNGTYRSLYVDLDPFTVELLRPIGFSLIQANIYISSGISFQDLFEFDKIGHVFTYYLTLLWLYLIIYELTKSKLFSLPSSLLGAQFGGHGIITPIYFLPASFSWQIGFAILYIFFSLYPKNSELKMQTRNSKIFWMLILFLIFSMYLFHFFTSLVMSICIIIFILLNSKYHKIFRNLLLISCLLLYLNIFLGRIIEIPFLNNLFLIIFGSSYYSSLASQVHLIHLTISELLIIISITLSINYILNNSNKNRKKISLSITFILFLFLYFQPFPNTFRILYIIFIYIIFLSFIFVKSIQNSLFKKIINFKEVKSQIVVKYTFTILILSVSIIPLISIFSVLKLDSKNEIYDNYNNRIYLSSYTLEEYNAALWCYNNLDIKNTIGLTDPGTGMNFFGISGLRSYKMDISMEYWAEYRSIFANCTSKGLDLNKLHSLLNNLSIKYLENTFINFSTILIFSPRTFKLLYTNKLLDKFFIADKSWINFTLLNFIENTNGITKIYNNSEIFIFNISF